MSFWLCLLSLSLPLLFWFGHVIRRDGPHHPVRPNTGLSGYLRITPGGMDQVRDRVLSQSHKLLSIHALKDRLFCLLFVLQVCLTTKITYVQGFNFAMRSYGWQNKGSGGLPHPKSVFDLNPISCILYLHLGTIVIQNPGNNEVSHDDIFTWS